MPTHRAGHRARARRSGPRIALLGFSLAFSLAYQANAAGPVELTPCRIDGGARFASVDARCATLPVAENPEAPNGRQIALRVAIVPALNITPQKDPLVLLAGGPGQSATELYLTFAPAFGRIRANRDILIVDQRGTGQSNPLQCPSSAEFVRSGHEDTEQLAKLVRECLSSLDADPRFYTTSVAVKDLHAVGQALGIDRFNLYGISYGTRVAQHFLRRYPDMTRSVILDGVVPPGLALGPGIAIDAQATFDALIARCDADSDCDARFPDVETAFAELSERLRAEPLEVALSDPATGERVTQRLSNIELAGAVRLMSYSPLTAALLPLVIDAAWRERHYEPLAAQVRIAESSLTESISAGMHNSVVCTEDAPYFDTVDVNPGALAETYLGDAVFEALQITCKNWPRGVIDEDFREPLESDVPVLLLSGENDPVTPPVYARRAAAGLANALHQVGPKQGHGLAPLGCVPSVIARFVERASIEGLDTKCIERLYTMPFFVDFSGPER